MIAFEEMKFLNIVYTMNRYRYKTELRKEDKANIRALVERQRHRLVCFWILFSLILFSVAASKHSSYVCAFDADYTRHIEGN